LLAALLQMPPIDRRGNAFGFFSLVSGIVLLIASLVAAPVDRIGASAIFIQARASQCWCTRLLLQLRTTPAATTQAE